MKKVLVLGIVIIFVELWAVSMVSASYVTYEFSGKTTSDWGWNFPTDRLAIGTEYTGQFTYNTDVNGVPSESYPYQYTYAGAIEDISLNFDGGYTFSATDGDITVSYNDEAHAFFWQTSNVITENGFNNFEGSNMSLALRDLNAASLSDYSIPTDLSGFYSNLKSANVYISSYSTDGAYKITGGITSMNGGTISQTPVPTTLLLFGSGIIGLVGIRRKYLQKKPYNNQYTDNTNADADMDRVQAYMFVS